MTNIINKTNKYEYIDFEFCIFIRTENVFNLSFIYQFNLFILLLCKFKIVFVIIILYICFPNNQHL